MKFQNLKRDIVVERGTYQELKGRHVNFSAWVSDLHPIEDDPTGVLDRVNEIKLDSINAPYTAPPKFANPLNPQRGSVSSLLGVPDQANAAPSISPNLLSRMKIKRPSPLATADVINAVEETTPDIASPGLNLEPNQVTIRQIMDLNAGSSQTSQIDEATISKMIEKNQSSVLTGTPSRPPANFSNQDIVSRTIEANQLTVHSISPHAINSITETATFIQTPAKPNLFSAYFIYLKEANLPFLAWAGLTAFLLLPAIRLISGMPVHDYFII